MIAASPRAVVESFKDMVTFDLRSVASDVSIPALIIEGEVASKSPISTVDILQKRIVGVQVRMIPNATHTVMLQRPQEFASAILDFAKTQKEGAVG